MMFAVIGLLLPVAAVWLALMATRLRTTGDSHAVTAALAVCLGIAASSITTFCFVHLGGTIANPFVAADALLWLAVAAASWWHMGPRPDFRVPEKRALSATEWAVRIVFVLTASIALAGIAAEYQASPHGGWDAWAIWNQKARFLLRAGEQWTASLAIGWSQPSHPLLVPASVARLWGYAGGELTIVPAMLGFTFGAAIVAAVTGALDLRRPRAWVAGSVLVAPGIFVQQVASQMSDLPVALFVVATLIMLSRTGAGASLLICGLLAGLTAWTKNEGLVLLAIVAPIVFWNALRYGRARDVVWWGAGVAPGIAIVAWLKLTIARVPPEYFSEAGSRASVLERVFDPARHELLSGLLGPFWMRWGGPAAAGVLPLVTAAALVVACTPGGRRARSTVLVALVMAAAYHVVWLLSPMETGWLIATSFERLLFQLWPSLVLAAFSYDNASPG